MQGFGSVPTVLRVRSITSLNEWKNKGTCATNKVMRKMRRAGVGLLQERGAGKPFWEVNI